MMEQACDCELGATALWVRRPVMLLGAIETGEKSVQAHGSVLPLGSNSLSQRVLKLRVDSLEKTRCWKRLRAGGEGGDKG